MFDIGGSLRFLFCIHLSVAYSDGRKPDCFSTASGDYTKCVMYKENTDTLHAVSVIAKRLRYVVVLNCHLVHFTDFLI